MSITAPLKENQRVLAATFFVFASPTKKLAADFLYRVSIFKISTHKSNSQPTFYQPQNPEF
jgi:hypothetical protein